MLAICLARPVLTRLQVAGANGSKSIVMLLDNSLSMSASAITTPANNATSAVDPATADAQTTAANLSTALDQATAQAEEVIAKFRSAEFGLLTLGGRSQNALNGTSFDPVRLKSELAKLKANAGPADLNVAMSESLKQLANMPNPSKQIVIFSDFQASQWAGLNEAQCKAIRDQLRSGDLDVHLTLLPCATKGSHRENLAVSIDAANQPAVVAGEPFQTKAVVHNLGTQDVVNARVVFSVDGQDLSSQVVNLPAGANETLTFACEFSMPGWHNTSVSIDDQRGVPADDQAVQVVHVAEPAELMIVEPPAAPSMQRGSGTLQLALAPFQNSPTGRDAFRLRLDHNARLTDESLEPVDAVVLVDVPQLSTESVSALLRYVQEGGGLIIFPGPKIDAGWYNRVLYEEAGLLPVAFGEKQKSVAERPQKFAEYRIQTPLLEIFNGSEAGDLADIDILEWFDLDATDIFGHHIWRSSSHKGIKRDLSCGRLAPHGPRWKLPGEAGVWKRSSASVLHSLL